ncbi:DUF896 domain-containing protein [Spiroplasma cantharicola]|uniref:Uncharacterized protein n=1 Tax=Spiroplasma cantharicola TaxID=362837 RepID=A0A0M4JSB1_9MOLU|nr:DUF896 domain-containing protein [Spiroplasma cantharicola]ALD66410.1 hypothetical protein SCANT_v1c05040 [Spiroplasma cantharicola]
MEIEELLKRINELAKIAKERELTPKEVKERDQLRKRYIVIFRQGLEQQLENVSIIDENGTITKPKKIK